MFSRALSIVVGVWAVALIAGAAMGNEDSWHPLAVLKQTSTSVVGGSNLANTNNGSDLANASQLPANQSNQPIKVTTLAELKPIISSHNKVLIDVTAEWCIECRIMDRTLFTNAPAALADWQVVKLDITENNDAAKKVLAHYQLFGPPALLYYVDGELKVQQVGETKRDTFEQTLETL